MYSEEEVEVKSLLVLIKIVELIVYVSDTNFVNKNAAAKENRIIRINKRR